MRSPSELFVIDRIVDRVARIFYVPSDAFDRLASGQEKTGNQNDAQYSHRKLR
jgi:hypothetical protein